MAALFGLLSAVLYGSSDFFGGLAARRIPALETSLVAFAGAAVVVLGIAVVVPPEWSSAAVICGAIAGLSGAIGQWAFYACLAIGPMSVLSPAVAMIYAIVPAVVGIAGGERFAPIGYAALVAVVVAAVLLAVPRGAGATRIGPRALLLGLVAGLGFAGWVIAIDAAPDDSGVAPVLVDYGVSLVVYLALLVVTMLRRRRSARRAGLDPAAFGLVQLERRGAGYAAIAGLQMGAANALLATGLHLGDLAIVGVLNALYPLGTVLLALALLGERLSRVQVLGIVLGLAAATVLVLR
ncbi:MAG: DMT family transporter [Actinomycetales bacterium]|nr:DMT family transporter [Actinomycetales bacterium]